MQLTEFDRNLLVVRPLSQRRHDLDISVVTKPDRNGRFMSDERLKCVGGRIIRAKENDAAVILMMGGHVIRSGVQRYLIDLMDRGYVSCIATNGAGMIHDFEFALIGATTESVAGYISEGQFGLWEETGRINDYINQGCENGEGMARSLSE